MTHEEIESKIKRLEEAGNANREKSSSRFFLLANASLITVLIGGIISFITIMVQKHEDQQTELLLEKKRFENSVIQKLIDRNTSSAKFLSTLNFYSKLGLIDISGVTKRDTTVNGKDSIYFTVPTPLNSGMNDCPTMGISNFTTGEGAKHPCWDRSGITAKYGDVINVIIYYHNNGATNFPEVSIRLTLSSDTTSDQGEITFRGDILSKGQVVTSDIVRLTVDGGDARVVFGHVAVYTQRSDENVTISNGDDIFSGDGLPIGDVPPGWGAQGNVTASFTVKSIP